MSNAVQTDYPENNFITRNKTFVIRALAVAAFFIALSFADFYLFPTTKTNDIIISYSKFAVGGKNRTKPTTVSYHFFTQKGFSFTTEKYVVDDDENEVTIEYSLLFKSVTKVKTKNKNYNKYLVNGLSINGIQFYFSLVLLLSIAISLKILLSEKPFSENAFYNIICFNVFMALICLYMSGLF